MNLILAQSFAAFAFILVLTALTINLIKWAKFNKHLRKQMRKE